MSILNDLGLLVSLPSSLAAYPYLCTYARDAEWTGTQKLAWFTRSPVRAPSTLVRNRDTR